MTDAAPPTDTDTVAETEAEHHRSAVPRGRRYAVRALLCAATVLAVLSVFALWANRQVLNADNWSETSSAMLSNDEIRTQVSGYLVDEVYANADVTQQIAAGLPPRLKPLAGPAANGLRDLAQRTTDRALSRPRVQEVWKEANRVTARQFIAIADGDSKFVTASGNALVLDVRSMVIEVIGRLGLPRSLSDKVPPDAGHIVIMSDTQVDTLKTSVSWVRHLAVVLPALAFLMLGGAVFLARERRRETLLIAGLDLIAAGLFVLVARSIAGGYVVDQLSSTAAVEPAAQAAWSIATDMLRDIAQATVVLGIPAVAAAWLAGPYRPAIGLRRAAAPTLRERPALVYSLVAVALLLVVAWDPIPATRLPIPVLAMTVLAFAAAAALRRQVAVEFPDAEAGQAGAALRSHAARAARAVQGARGGGPRASQPLEQLERLSTLHDRGALSDAEFAEQKTLVLTHGNGSR
jgi:hypothetical protein